MDLAVMADYGFGCSGSEELEAIKRADVVWLSDRCVCVDEEALRVFSDTRIFQTFKNWSQAVYLRISGKLPWLAFGLRNISLVRGDLTEKASSRSVLRRPIRCGILTRPELWSDREI